MTLRHTVVNDTTIFCVFALLLLLLHTIFRPFRTLSSARLTEIPHCMYFRLIQRLINLLGTFSTDSSGMDYQSNGREYFSLCRSEYRLGIRFYCNPDALSYNSTFRGISLWIRCVADSPQALSDTTRCRNHFETKRISEATVENMSNLETWEANISSS